MNTLDPILLSHVVSENFASTPPPRDYNMKNSQNMFQAFFHGLKTFIQSMIQPNIN